MAVGILWAAGGYLAGTFPSTLLVARARRAPALEAASNRSAGETDAHILTTQYLGVGWMALAATLDVLKAFGWVLGARHWGGLSEGWVAVSGVAVVLGHSFPFYARQMAGRGLAAASGVDLALLPWEMVVAGLLIVLGGAVRSTSLFTTVGMASVPIVAAATGQPGALVAMGVAVFVLLMVRRLEGIGAVIRSGIAPGRAVVYRCVFDSSSPPGPPRWFQSHRQGPSA